MSEFKKLSHVIYRCDYHMVWTLKYRFKILEGIRKQQLQEDLVMLLEWLGCQKKELNIQIDHIHPEVSIPPKLLISKVMRVLNAKTAIKIFKSYPKLKIHLLRRWILNLICK